MSTLYLFDFEDSFTFNIFGQLKTHLPKHNIVVISKADHLTHLRQLSIEEENFVVILGPGPGHPEQYREYHEVLHRLLRNPGAYMMGICLGHQILWESFGAKIRLCETPIHGQTKSYSLSDDFGQYFTHPNSLVVQHYNSLYVQYDEESENYLSQLRTKSILHIERNETVLAFAQNFASFQFHPESIGTTCPEYFFKPITDFLV